MTTALPHDDNQGTLAEIRLHRAIAKAHEEYAHSIAALTSLVEVEEAPPLRGSVQRRIVALPDMATTRGMTSRSRGRHNRR
jgi:hypothetical protein